MNVIPFVITILTVLTYGMSLTYQNKINSMRNQIAYNQYRNAELKILKKSQKMQFKHLPGKKVLVENEKKTKNKTKLSSTLNQECAKFNLFPLIDEGKETHPALFETVLKFLRLFYAEKVFAHEKNLDQKILEALLKAAKLALKENKKLDLETLSLNDPSLQLIYYKLLKGTKNGYPPLSDFLKIEKEPSKICIYHANHDLLAIFFGEKTASQIEQILQNEKATTLSLDAIFQVASDATLRFKDPKVFDLIDFTNPKHAENPWQTIVAEDDTSKSSARKNIYFKKSS